MQPDESPQNCLFLVDKTVKKNAAYEDHAAGVTDGPKRLSMSGRTEFGKRLVIVMLRIY